jgi:hypothetical protein
MDEVLKTERTAGDLFIVKFGVAFTFLLNYLVVIELFPTLFRATSAGFCNFTGRLFGIAAPIVAELPQPTPWLAFLVVSVAAGLISTFLKVEETKQKSK